MNIFQAYKINKEIKGSKNTPNYEYKEVEHGVVKDTINLNTKRYSITACKIHFEYPLFDPVDTYDTSEMFTFAAHNQKTYRHIASRGMFARIFFNKLYGKVKK